MMGKKLSTFLAILAIAFDSVAAVSQREIKPCSELSDCRKCLSKTANGCAWAAGPDFTGCIDADKCDSEDYEGSECISGKTGDKGFNIKTCGGTCGTQSDSSCEDCLSYDPFGKDKKGACAWFVRPGADPQCVYNKRCKDRGFDNGKCVKGKKDGDDNSKKCAVEPIDKCEKRDSCQRCFNSKKGSDNCAWYVDGEDAKCIDELRCDEKGFEMGTCHKGSTIFDTKKTCTAIQKKDDEVGFEKCSDFTGLCTDCLINGCYWVNQHKECVTSCTEAPADVGCSGTTPPEIFNDRSLLRFVSDPSEMCYNFKLEDKNTDLCMKAANQGCTKCVNTQLFTPPGMFYVTPPTCFFYPDTGYCLPEPSGMMGSGSTTCEDDEIGFEKCSDFTGLCTDCLINGCYWVNQHKECVTSCTEAPADVGCSGTTPPEIFNDRSLLRFDSEASEMCYNFELEDQNMDLCMKAANQGCKKCVNTQMFTPPGMFYVTPPTCFFYPDTGYCLPEPSGMMGSGSTTCEDDVVSILPIAHPGFKLRDGTKWPELLDEDINAAVKFLEEKYGPDLLIVPVVKGSIVIEDYRLDRVRLYVDEETQQTIVEIPIVG